VRSGDDAACAGGTGKSAAELTGGEAPRNRHELMTHDTRRTR
jgi:hypothetical protein